MVSRAAASDGLVSAHRAGTLGWGPLICGSPKLRESSYFPEWLLDARTRSERAFIQVVAEAYVRGVSTRRVEGLVEALGVASLSKSQVSELAKGLDEMVTDFRNRPLDAGPYTYVWADALTMKVPRRWPHRQHRLPVGGRGER